MSIRNILSVVSCVFGLASIITVGVVAHITKNKDISLALMTLPYMFIGTSFILQKPTQKKGQ